MLQIKNTLGGGKPEGLYAWKKHEIGSEPKKINESVSTLPFGFYNSSAVVLNGEIHILGGTVQPKYHYKWDGTSWTSVSTLPYDFYIGSVVVLNGEIHILGGDWNGTRHYKWDGSSWTSVGTLPYDFYNGSAVVLDGEIHILGSGNNSNSYYTNHYKWDGTSWTSVSTLPYVFYNSSAVVFNNEIHILGGGNNTAAYTNHYKWDGTSWTSVSTLPYDFYDGSAVVFNNEIHILGGSANTAANTNHYKWNGSSWESVGTLPYSFDDGSAVIYNNTIHILGSYNSNYRTAHYLVYGYVTVYTFLDYIVSDKETAYPDGGEKGGYWYERVSEGISPEMFGCTKMAVDTYTPTANIKMGDVTLYHSLGEIPRLVIIVSDNMDSYDQNTNRQTIKICYITNWTGSSKSNFNCNAVKSYDSANSDSAATNANVTLSSSYIKGNSNYAPGVNYLYGGDKYTIYTFA